MKNHILTGFGFGPIQASLFAREAYRSGVFSRIVIAELNQGLIDALQNNAGTYYINVAKTDGIEVEEVRGVELVNPLHREGQAVLIEALGQSSEIVTSLPSVDFYTQEGGASIARMMAEGLVSGEASATLVYAAENNHQAAEMLKSAVAGFQKSAPRRRMQFMNTVIGKMSQVVSGNLESNGVELRPIAPGVDKAFLVEEFNSIYTDPCMLDGFTPGITAFKQKQNLKPFEEAKLYGHNAIHALLAYLGRAHGYERMSDLGKDQDLLDIAGRAFRESGEALCRKYAGLDPLFTEEGFRVYSEDLLERMVNPYLGDTVARAGRDIVRKLGVKDRLVGAMSLALEQGVVPRHLAQGAAAALSCLLGGAERAMLPSSLLQFLSGDSNVAAREILEWIWRDQQISHKDEILNLILAERPVCGKVL